MVLEFKLRKHIGRLITIGIWFIISLVVLGISTYGIIMKFKFQYLLVLAFSIIGVLYYGDFVLGFITSKAKTISFWMKNERLHWIAKDKNGNKVYENSVGLEDTTYIEIIEYRRKIQKDKYFHLLDTQKKTIREQEFYDEFYELSDEGWNEVMLLIVNSNHKIQFL